MMHENIANFPMVDKKPGWSFYVAWIFLTTLSLPLAFIVVMFLLRIVNSVIGDTIYVNGVKHITEDYLALYFLVPVMALVTGAAQYGMLRLYLPRMRWWIPATVGGWLMGMLPASILIQLHWMDPSNVTMVLMLGLSIGFGQWLVLRRRLSRAGWWIVANLVGWAVILLFGQGNAVGQEGLLIIGFFPACATAVALALLMKQDHATDPPTA